MVIKITMENNEIIYYSNKYDELRVEYQNMVFSPEFRIGKKLYQFPLLKYLWQMIRKDKLERKELNYEKFFLTKEDLEWKPKVAVYQAVVGNYDSIPSIFPLYKKIYNYFLFTNLEVTIKDMDIKRIPNKIRGLDNPVLINRYLKMHPYELFQGYDYDYAVYIDGNVQIISDIRPLLRQSSSETGLALHHHFTRDCIYDEADACIKSKKGNKDKILKQIDSYRKAGFPKHWGLFECNIIIFDLRNNNGKNISSLWWEEFLSSESMRDQLSLPYTLWVNGYQENDVGSFFINVHKNPKLFIHKHKIGI